ncbi:MAG TPA: cytochrome b5-like heme/steroid binding domain-containing protein [Gammaproteobacteria bacterium]|nr:cytochrome b5-like heme/steroid binding domain-containing protein [Gammaproteobacteria bacterium]
MRKLAYTAFVAFWASVLTLLFVDRLVPASSEASPETKEYTSAEVARHGSEVDCWMAIDGKVYDVTSYLPDHPAPPAVMLPWCGKDASEGMHTKGYGREHSPAAWAELERYRIGVLVE